MKTFSKGKVVMEWFYLLFSSCLLFLPRLPCTVLCICYFPISLHLWLEVLLVLLFFKETKTKMWSTKFRTHYLENAPQCQYSFTLISSTGWLAKNPTQHSESENTIFIHFTQICRQHPASSRAELGLHCYCMTWLNIIKRFLQAAPINAIRNVTY